MNCLKIKIFMLTIFTTITVVTVPASAEVSAGIYNYFVWWKPAFSGIYKDIKTDSGFMTGPVISWSFLENWSLSFLCLFPIDGFKTEYTAATGNDGTNDWIVKFKTDTNRIDIDTSASYSLNSYFKLFSGIKVTMIVIDGEGVSKNEFYYMGTTRTEEGYDGSIKLPFAYGLGAGMGFSYPLNKMPFALTGSFSMLWYPSYTIVGQKITGPTNPGVASSPFNSEEMKYVYNGYGLNTTLSISYFIKSLDVSIAPGGRFQLVKFIQTKGEERELDIDLYYGFTLSIMYYF